MNKQKQKSNTTKNKRKVFPKIIALVFLLIALGLGVYVVTTYVKQQQTLRELEIVGKDLEGVYNNLLAANTGNVRSSYFRNECTYSYAGPYSKMISCGKVGDIALNTGFDSLAVEKVLLSSIEGTAFKVDSGITTREESSGLDITSKKVNNTRCYISYGYSQGSVSWGYHLFCKQSVPDFLPGYTVVD